VTARLRTLRSLAYLALAVAVTHLIFGAVVRISGSGMGCGENWPKCYGHWFPPLDQPTLIIEWTHRLLASLLILTFATLAFAAWRWRDEPGVGGRGGVLRAAVLALSLAVLAALFGMVTVFLGNAPLATVGHWTIAAATVATLSAAVIRAGGLGGVAARAQEGSRRAMRGAIGGASIAFVTVIMGGVTAKIPGASFACPGFPLCGSPLPPSVGQHVQLTHRVLAFLLALHVIGLVIGFTRRREAPVVIRTVWIALLLVFTQIGIAASMILLGLPPALRSLHQATGVMLWISLFVLAYLARIAAGASAVVRTSATANRVPGRAEVASAPSALFARGADA
jgi:heme A synthase